MTNFTPEVNNKIQAVDQTVQYVDGRSLEDYKGYTIAAAELEAAAYKRFKLSQQDYSTSKASSEKQMKTNFENEYAAKVSKLKSAYDQGVIKTARELDTKLRALDDQYFVQDAPSSAKELMTIKNSVVGVNVSGKLMDAQFDREKRSEIAEEEELKRQVVRDENVRNTMIDNFKASNPYLQNASDDQVLSAMKQTEYASSQMAYAVDTIASAQEEGRALTRVEEEAITKANTGAANMAVVNALKSINLAQIDAKTQETLYQTLVQSQIQNGTPLPIAQSVARRSLQLLGTDVAVKDRDAYADAVGKLISQNVMLDPSILGTAAALSKHNPTLGQIFVNNVESFPELQERLMNTNVNDTRSIPTLFEKHGAQIYEAAKDDPKMSTGAAVLMLQKQEENLDVTESEEGKKISVDNVERVAKDAVMNKEIRSTEDNDKIAQESILALNKILSTISEEDKKDIVFDTRVNQYRNTNEESNTTTMRHSLRKLNETLKHVGELSNNSSTYKQALQETNGIRTATAEDIKNLQPLYSKTDVIIDTAIDTFHGRQIAESAKALYDLIKGDTKEAKKEFVETMKEDPFAYAYEAIKDTTVKWFEELPENEVTGLSEEEEQFFDELDITGERAEILGNEIEPTIEAVWGERIRNSNKKLKSNLGI